MRRRRPILAVLSALLIAAAGIVCCCMRMSAAAVAEQSNTTHSCCQPTEGPHSVPKECDRCEFAGFGGLVLLQSGKAITVAPPELVAMVSPPPIDWVLSARLAVDQPQPRPPWLDVTPLSLRTLLTL